MWFDGKSGCGLAGVIFLFCWQALYFADPKTLFIDADTADTSAEGGAGEKERPKKAAKGKAKGNEAKE